jgi:hypothetical protein
MDQIGGNAARPEIVGEALGETDQRRLAHGVETDARHRHPLGEATANADDAPAGTHVPRRGLGSDEDAAHMDR